MKHLLKEIELLKKEYDLIRNTEEQFNIFSVMYKNHEEVKLHSRFLSSLLNPKGSHKQGDKFLKIFLSLFDFIDYKCLNKIVVYPSEINKKEYNNIDILIIDRVSRNAIIIENKIYAEDSNNEDSGQLERYFNFIRDEEKIPSEDITVFYLTLDGHNPSDESLGEFKTLENINGHLISYEKHILQWLNNCVKEVVNKPFIRESINQYIKLLNKMTNNEIDVNGRIRLKEIIGKSESSITSTKYLIDNFKHVEWHTIADFWNELELELENNDFKIIRSFDNVAIDYLIHHSQNKKEEETGIVFKSDNVEIYIWHERYEYLYFGIEKENNKRIHSIMSLLSEKKKFEQNNSCWWNYIEMRNGEKLNLKDFSSQNTFNLINPEKRKETIDDIIEVIKKIVIDIKTMANKGYK